MLSGHEHLYQRTLPLRYEGKLVSTYGGPGGGVGYLVSPAVGADPSGDLLAESSPERARLAYPGPSVVGGGKHVWNGFVQITLQGKTITIQAYALGETTPRDTTSYSKP